MRPIIVGVAGGIASGKKLFASRLASKLRNREMIILEMEHHPNKALPPLCSSFDCLVVHGPSVFSDPCFVDRMDVKVFIDVDADIRLSRLLERESTSTGEFAEKYSTTIRRFHVDSVLKSKKLADVWVEQTSSDDKLDQIVDLVLQARERTENDREPVEVEVYLQKNKIVPDAPVPSDFN